MVASAMTRRGALAALGAFGLTLTGAASGARAQSGLRFSTIVVNVEPLRALTGDPTAAWMEQALAQALPRALGPHLAPGDRNAPILEVQIDWIYLAPSPGGPGPRGSAQDTIIGSFLVRGPQGGDRVGNPVAGDRVLLSERRRPGARRARLSRAHCHARPDLRGLGAEGARALGVRRFKAVLVHEGRAARGVSKDAECAPVKLRTGLSFETRCCASLLRIRAWTGAA